MDRTAKADGLIAKYKVATWDTIPLKDPDGYWWAEYYGFLIFEVIKGAVPTPADWEDLLKPEYKGKVAMAGDVLKSNESVHDGLRLRHLARRARIPTTRSRPCRPPSSAWSSGRK